MRYLYYVMTKKGKVGFYINFIDDFIALMMPIVCVTLVALQASRKIHQCSLLDSMCPASLSLSCCL